MEALWTGGALSVREILESFALKGRPAFGTVQTIVFRLEAKQAVRRVGKVSNALIFEAAVSRGTAQAELIDELLDRLGGKVQPVMARLTESGKLTLDDVREAEHLLRRLAGKDKPE